MSGKRVSTMLLDGESALLDTNILIDYLNGLELARIEMARYTRCAISIITWMEVLVGVSDEEEAVLKHWLGMFELIGIDDSVAQLAVQIRRRHRIRLPDAIIWASAQQHGYVLVSRNSRDFPANALDVRVPYQL